MRFRFRNFACFSVLCIDLILIQMHTKVATVNTKNTFSNIKVPARKRTNITKVTNYSLNRLYFKSNIFDISKRDIKMVKGEKVVMFYNMPEYMNNFLKNDLRYENCEYQNCILTRNKINIANADALIFYIGIRNTRLGNVPPINTEHRNPNQVWIFTSVEPPEHYYNIDYKSPSWYNTMNWSSLYRLDSDIPNPYGCLVSQTIPNQENYQALYYSKTRNALWIVSHCQVASERRLYINEMIKHGFQVDILGGCSSDGSKISQNELEELIPTYKYFLAFENSMCTDYISEKFFQYYNMSWIMVVRGGADYNRLLPYRAFINTADFTNISSLVQYLSNIANDKIKYTEFLQYKDRYVSIRWPGNRNCEICRRLNNLSKFRKTYSRISDYVTDGQCKRPVDF